MKRAAAVILAAAVALPAAAYVLPTDALLDQMEERVSQHDASNQRVTGTLIRFDADGERAGTSPAEHLVRMDGRCRLQVLERGEEGPWAAWRRGRVTDARGNGLSDLALMEALACPLLSVDEGAAAVVRRLLRDLRVDTGYTGLSRLEGRPAFVIGARPWEEDRPQLWLDKDTFLPVRLVGRIQGVQGDVRLTGYGDPATGEWHPWQMELWRDGRKVLRFTAERLEQGVPLDDALFP